MAAPREPQDHKAPAKRTTTARQRKPTAAEMATVDAAARVEAEAEAYDTDWIDVPLGDDILRVRPYQDWPKNVYRAWRNQGDFEALTEVIHPDDQKTWDESPATLGDVGDFITEAIELSGQARGESRPSRTSSRGTPRR